MTLDFGTIVLAAVVLALVGLTGRWACARSAGT